MGRMINFVEETEEAAILAATAHYGNVVELRRDEDILDMVSSGLWPFSTLGWPEAMEVSVIIQVTF